MPALAPQDHYGRINSSTVATISSSRPPLGRVPRASAVQEAAQRHRREPARSVLDGASTVLCSTDRDNALYAWAQRHISTRNEHLTAGRKSTLSYARPAPGAIGWVHATARHGPTPPWPPDYSAPPNLSPRIRIVRPQHRGNLLRLNPPRKRCFSKSGRFGAKCVITHPLAAGRHR